VSGEPFSESDTRPFKANWMGSIDSVDTMFLGATLTNSPRATGPSLPTKGEYGEKLNNLTKYVASATIDDAPCHF
jgi:hypothetical protein